MRHGTVFSIAGTASGRLFAAHWPVAGVRPIYEAERQSLARTRRRNGDGATATPNLPAWRTFEADLIEVRRHGLGRSEGAVVAGVSALSAPVFDHRGAMVLALTAIGPSAAFDARWTGRVASVLREAAQTVSARLGHGPVVQRGKPD
jgi:DNA-binding IclR family transcriptional regulator